MNIETYSPFDTDIVFRARCIACVSAVNIELNIDSDVDSVQFAVVTAAPTPILLFRWSKYMCFHPL